MNGYRATGDTCHLLAMILLLANILWRRSCAGFSGRTQLLFALVFINRYFDLFVNYVSTYNTVLKITYILVTLSTCILIFGVFRKTYQKEVDTFRFELLLVLCISLAFFVNYEESAMEICWAFSIYLEAVAILPQLFMLYNLGFDFVSRQIVIYLSLLGLYRFFYILNWWYRFKNEDFYDEIAVVSGIVQTLIFFIAGLVYLSYLMGMWKQQKTEEKMNGSKNNTPWNTLLNPKTIQNMPPMLINQCEIKMPDLKKY